MPKNQNQLQSWKTSDWVMTKSSIIVEGTLCDEYQNQKTGQIVYEGMEESKAINFDKKLEPFDDYQHLDCRNKGNDCHVAVIDGERVLIVKPGTSIWW